MDQQKILAAVLAEMAILMELKGENPFKIRAYSNASRIIESLREDLGVLVEKGELRTIKGIGKGLASLIEEWVRTGSMREFDELKRSIPPELPSLLRVPGLGPKKVHQLFEKLDIRSLGELEYACQENRLLDLPGFGRRTQEKILEGIKQVRRYEGKFLSAEAMAVASELLGYMEKAPGVAEVSVAGSLRRFKEIVKDIDLVASSDTPEPVMGAFLEHPGVSSVVAGGPTKSSIVLVTGIPVDIRVVPPVSFAFALHHFTGSKEHNTALRGLARKRSWKLNEYGLFEGDTLLPCKDEAELYGRFDLAYIPPELREDLGEIEAAAAGSLPELVRQEDVRGIFHAHTHYSDGSLSVRELAAAVRDLGYDYLGITDHSQSAYYAGGLKAEDLDRQREEIERVREEIPGFDIYWGIESDILSDGALDYPASILERFDFVIGSIHSQFTQEPALIMERLIRALENPFLTILGHPTGRLLLGRDGYPVDHEQILEAAARNAKVIELNANPHRLDLDWRWCRRARDLGVKISINPDAHSASGLQDVRYGVMAARKGWLRREDVWNGATKEQMRRLIAAKPWRSKS